MARLTTLLFAMWLGVTVSTVVDLEKRIIRGKTCGPNERWYHVKLIFTDINGKQSLCGGSLISDQWILTAGHCFEQGGTFTAHIGVHPGPPTKVPITDPPVIFKNAITSEDHDLMLLKLPEAVGIKPVQLPDCQYRPKTGAVVQVAGHGRTLLGTNDEKLPSSSYTLQCADLNIIDCQEFKDKFSAVAQAKKHEHWLCYKSTLVDACKGDSGGGVVYQCQIYGVHVMSDPIACASPAVSMDLCYQPYLKWIKDTIKQP